MTSGNCLCCNSIVKPFIQVLCTCLCLFVGVCNLLWKHAGI